MGKGGIVLPVALMALLGVGLVAIGLVAAARSEILSDRSAMRYVRRGASARSLLGEDGAGPGRSSLSLAAGYRLVGAAPDTLGLTHFALRWELEPDSVAASLPGAVEATTLPAVGLEVSPACPLSLARPATRSPGPLSGGRVGPMVGILGPTDLSALAGADAGPALEGTTEPRVFSMAPDVRIERGEAFGVLVSEGDIVLAGTSRFVGLVVSGGSVLLHDAAAIEGVILAARTIGVGDGAHIVGCVERARDALAAAELTVPHPLPSGGFLGRY